MRSAGTRTKERSCASLVLEIPIFALWNILPQYSPSKILPGRCLRTRTKADLFALAQRGGFDFQVVFDREDAAFHPITGYRTGILPSKHKTIESGEL